MSSSTGADFLNDLSCFVSTSMGLNPWKPRPVQNCMLHFPLRIYIAELHATCLHHASTIQDCMLCFPSRCHRAEMYATHPITLPQLRTTCNASRHTSSLQNFMPCVSITLPQRRNAWGTSHRASTAQKCMLYISFEVGGRGERREPLALKPNDARAL